MPFSDPLADGPVIQRATERALAGGMTLAKTLDLVEEPARPTCARRSCSSPTPIPILRMGIDAFAAGRARPASTACWCSTCRSRKPGRCRRALAADGHRHNFPVQPDDDRRAAAPGRRAGQRVSLRHLAARRDRAPAPTSPTGAEALATRMRAETAPAARARLRHLAARARARRRPWADAAVVGSALVEVIAEPAIAAVAGEVERYVRWLKDAPRRSTCAWSARWLNRRSEGAGADRAAATRSTRSTRCSCALLDSAPRCALEIGRLKELLQMADLPAGARGRGAAHVRERQPRAARRRRDRAAVRAHHRRGAAARTRDGRARAHVSPRADRAVRAE